MAGLKAAFGAGENYNPCKAFPTHKGCGVVSQARVQRAAAAGAEMWV
jgi:hypothetical protein